MKKPSPKDKALVLAGQLYYRWKLDTFPRLVKEGEGDPKKIIDSLLDLRNELVLKVKAQGLEQWMEFTTKLLDEKVQIIALKGLRNVNRLILAGHPEIKPYLFSTQEEFLAIPEVAGMRAKPGFIGFVGGDATVSGLFEDGEMVKLGAVISDLGLKGLVLSQAAVAKALENILAQPGSPGGTDGSHAKPPGETHGTAQPSAKAPYPSASGPESPAEPNAS